MTSPLSFFRRYMLPEALKSLHVKTLASKAAPESNRFYAKAIRNLLDTIDEPVVWSPSGKLDGAHRLSNMSVEEISNLLKAQSMAPAAGGMRALPRKFAGDIVMNEDMAQLAKQHSIAGSAGPGTGASVLHELGHLRDIKRHPIANYMDVTNAAHNPIGELAEMGGGKGVLGAEAMSSASRSPGILNEIRATLGAHGALSRAGAPAGVKFDLWKRLAPALGTHIFPGISDII
jgi:hypothetical protein